LKEKNEYSAIQLPEGNTFKPLGSVWLVFFDKGIKVSPGWQITHWA
jgi:hypothetical protein